jgi:hypothetical protein
VTSRHIVRNVKTDSAKEFITHLEKLSYTRSRWEVFSDWTTLASSSIYNSVHQDPTVEAEYMDIAKRYKPEEITMMGRMLGCVVDALENDPSDVMGEIYEGAQISSDKLGQFFTPTSVCKLMAQVEFGNAEPSSRILAICEPACGAGAMLLEACSVLQSRGINYQRDVYIEAIDVDPVCFRMCYIQLSLIGACAVVVNGNALTMETHRRWATPMYVINWMGPRLANQRAREHTQAIPSDTPNTATVNTNTALTILTATSTDSTSLVDMSVQDMIHQMFDGIEEPTYVE